MEQKYHDIIKNDQSVDIWSDEVKAIIDGYGGVLPEGKIIFTGSSSIRLWNTLLEDMKPMEVLKHGIGGSRLFDSIYYADELVFQFNPRAVVVYAGSNDITGFEGTKSAEDTFLLAKDLFIKYRENMPNVKLYYISININNNRPNAFSESLKFNDLMKEFIDEQDNMIFIETWQAFLDENSVPDDSLFIEDKLHLNDKGYKIWTKLIKPVLMADL